MKPAAVEIAMPSPAVMSALTYPPLLPIRIWPSAGVLMSSAIETLFPLPAAPRAELRVHLVELREGFSEGFASLQNGDPRESGLEAF